MLEKTPLRLALERARARHRAETAAAEVAASAPRTTYYEDVEPEPDPDAYDERWLTVSERRAVEQARNPQQQVDPADAGLYVIREGAPSPSHEPRVWRG
jgi:hypothetical protein